MVSLKAYYPGNFTDEQVGPFSLMFMDTSVEELRNAIAHHVTASKRPPCVAELREIIFGKDPRNDINLHISFAWKAVLMAAENYGQYKSVQFDDPRCNYAVLAVGWEKICQSQIDDPWVKKEFEEKYKEAHNLLKRGELNGVERVKGAIEIANSGNENYLAECYQVFSLPPYAYENAMKQLTDGAER